MTGQRTAGFNFMNIQDQIRAAAELDGETPELIDLAIHEYRYFKPYDTSYDAIIPLIVKWWIQ